MSETAGVGYNLYRKLKAAPGRIVWAGIRVEF